MNNTKLFNDLLDNYLINRTCCANDYEQLTFEQKFVINEIKKSYKRIIKPTHLDKHHSLQNI